MKKLAAKKRKPPGRKRRAAPSKGVDIALVRRLLAEHFPPEEDSLEDMVEAVLSTHPDEPEHMPSAEALSEIDQALNQARIDASGGDAQARETLKNVHSMIDEAAGRDAIHPVTLAVLGRLLAGAQIDIGDAARAAMGRAVDAGKFLDSGEEAYRAFVRPLLSTSKDGPFALNKEIDALIAIFPADHKAAFVELLAADPNLLARKAAVGFLLHREEALALAAIRGLAAAAARGDLDYMSRRWIEMIRRWLAPGRKGAIDAALPFAGVAVPRVVPQVVKAAASLCDGSGASGLYAMVRSGSRYTVVSVMAKPGGVADAVLFEDLSQSEVTAFERAIMSATPTSEVSLATLSRLLRLALGRNLSHDSPPPFALVEAVEAIGLDMLTPDPATPAEIIESALAGVSDQDRAATTQEAHERVADGEFADNWFEAGEDVDAILEATESVDDGARALLESCLPGRRAFWAIQCAQSALALKDASAAGDDTWRRLALVGRDILCDVPLSDIPLMRQIAERSAASYFMQR